MKLNTNFNMIQIELQLSTYSFVSFLALILPLISAILSLYLGVGVYDAHTPFILKASAIATAIFLGFVAISFLVTAFFLISSKIILFLFDVVPLLGAAASSSVWFCSRLSQNPNVAHYHLKLEFTCISLWILSLLLSIMVMTYLMIQYDHIKPVCDPTTSQAALNRRSRQSEISAWKKYQFSNNFENQASPRNALTTSEPFVPFRASDHSFPNAANRLHIESTRQISHIPASDLPLLDSLKPIFKVRHQSDHTFHDFPPDPSSNLRPRADSAQTGLHERRVGGFHSSGSFCPTPSQLETLSPRVFSGEDNSTRYTHSAGRMGKRDTIATPAQLRVSVQRSPVKRMPVNRMNEINGFDSQEIQTEGSNNRSRTSSTSNVNMSGPMSVACATASIRRRSRSIIDSQGSPKSSSRAALKSYSWANDRHNGALNPNLETEHLNKNLFRVRPRKRFTPSFSTNSDDENYEDYDQIQPLSAKIS